MRLSLPFGPGWKMVLVEFWGVCIHAYSLLIVGVTLVCREWYVMLHDNFVCGMTIQHAPCSSAACGRFCCCPSGWPGIKGKNENNPCYGPKDAENLDSFRGSFSGRPSCILFVRWRGGAIATTTTTTTTAATRITATTSAATTNSYHNKQRPGLKCSFQGLAPPGRRSEILAIAWVYGPSRHRNQHGNKIWATAGYFFLAKVCQV